jgi:hypothetical protein
MHVPGTTHTVPLMGSSMRPEYRWRSDSFSTESAITGSQPSNPCFGDSRSGPLFTIHSKAAEEEGNKVWGACKKMPMASPFCRVLVLAFMVLCKKTGALQTGLFSAAVAALLAVTVQDLRPNSQDISASILGALIVVVALSPRDVRLSNSSGASSLSLYGSCPLTLFPEFADMKCVTMGFSHLAMRHRFLRPSPLNPLPWQTSPGSPLFH